MASHEADILLCVFGATGQQGGAVLRYFARTQEHTSTSVRLRGVTRNRKSDAARKLADMGVEMVEADLGDVGTIERALVGVTHVFATTDSNRTIYSAISKPEILPQGHSPRSYAYELEIQQGKNLLQAAAASTTLRVLVWSSLTSPKKWSHGRYTKVSMWDAKEEIADMLAADSGIRDKLRILVLGFFTTNALAVPELYAPRKARDGVYELALPMSGDTAVPIADLEADTGRWVEALFTQPSGTKLVGATALIPWSRWLAYWGEINHVPVRYRRAGAKEFESKVDGIGDAVLEEFQFIDEYGFVGSDTKPIYPEQLSQQGPESQTSDLRKLMSLQDWSPLLH
ncbi:hypothetical protein AMS68_005878 [Peltaster fructicola]|uniref:NmrA-like domain-containing protein n=1 Tax=Peltaster fructicola TaxID=286661 RepID=A0A6H0Y0B6_9PEZI|nr:hypothetical protein AMS68_005878 [Peltaster fructicola]